MRIFKLFVVAVIVLVYALPSFSQISSMQLFYLVKQAFPDAQEVNIFISSDNLRDEKDKIARATVQFQLKAIVYEISSAADIGNSTKKLADNSVTILYDDKVFDNSKNKLYILSKCKEKQIPLVTSSMDYIQSGALLGYVVDAGQKKIILNLTYYDHLKSKFSSEVVQQLGITEVIPKDYLTSAQ